MKKNGLRPERPPRDESMRCSFCGCCAPCPKGIDIVSVIRLLEETENQCADMKKVQEEYRALPRSAGRCVACRQCESRCPSCVPVVKSMRRAYKIFRR